MPRIANGQALRLLVYYQACNLHLGHYHNHIRRTLSNLEYCYRKDSKQKHYLSYIPTLYTDMLYSYMHWFIVQRIKWRWVVSHTSPPMGHGSVHGLCYCSGDTLHGEWKASKLFPYPCVTVCIYNVHHRWIFVHGGVELKYQWEEKSCQRQRRAHGICGRTPPYPAGAQSIIIIGFVPWPFSLLHGHLQWIKQRFQGMCLFTGIVVMIFLHDCFSSAHVRSVCDGNKIIEAHHLLQL